MGIRRKLVATAAILACAAVPNAAAQDHDDFDHLIEINMASLVMLVEEGFLPASLAASIAEGTLTIEEEQRAEGARRSSNYLVFERRLLELAGAEASRLHTARSRQDIGSTMRRLILRESLLDVYEAQLAARASLLALARKNADVVIPAYTHGVQAQPVSAGHYLHAFASALERDAERLRQAFSTLNRSPLGAAALGTSGFRLDRERLAELLGFDGIVRNSYDANLVSSVDSKLEYANAMAVSAITVGQLMENLHTQYHGATPWFLLSEEETDVSSIMPQKRNPRPIDRVRTLATGVVGSAHIVTLNAHNTASGMNDYRPASATLEAAGKAEAMYAGYANVLDNLVVLPERALAEINREYSTMTEVADVLLREADVPFRVAHHYASELTGYGRARGKRPLELTETELESVYREAIGAPLPIDVALIRAAMDPVQMVGQRRGQGGPQPAEVDRLLADAGERLAEDRRWLHELRGRLGERRSGLRNQFRELANR